MARTFERNDTAAADVSPETRPALAAGPAELERATDRAAETREIRPAIRRPDLARLERYTRKPDPLAR